MSSLFRLVLYMVYNITQVPIDYTFQFLISIKVESYFMPIAEAY